MNALLDEIVSDDARDDVLARARARIESSDTFESYWLDVLLREVRDTHDMPYRHMLGTLLERLLAHELVVVSRCRACARLFAHSVPPSGPWRAYCERRCRDQYFHARSAVRR
jgi:hypothetical protein